MVKIGIYKITSPKGRVYIGQSTDILKRWKSHKHNYKRFNWLLYNSFKKYGFDKHKFEIVTECASEELNELERYYQEIYNCLGKGGLNCILTKSSDKTGAMSTETKLKLSIALTGKVRTPEQKERLRKIVTGRKHSEETKNKIREFGIGRKMPREGVIKSVNARRGFKHSDETKKILREKNIGKKMSEATINKMKNSLKGRVCSKETRMKIGNAVRGFKHSEETKLKVTLCSSKLVLNYETGIYYDSAKIAAKSINMPHSTFCKKISGFTKTNNTSFKYA